MTKQDKINAIVASVVDWDIDNLVDYVQNRLKFDLENTATDRDIDIEYKMVINHELD